jgi:arylsulfatase A-like enzyme
VKLLTRVAYIIVLTCLFSVAAQGRTKPNIIIIVADDLGYADLGCQGSKDCLMPNIDSIARNGVRFTDGYVSCPVCSPTRAGLMTGKYQNRFGHEFNPGAPVVARKNDFGLSLKEKTLADRLKFCGYATGMFGKWHLGLAEKYNPINRGFDEYFGFLHGMHDYLDWGSDLENPVLRGTKRQLKNEYLTDVFTREALLFIEAHQSQPFFIYLPYNAVHMPLEVLGRYKKRFPNVPEGKRKTYLAMLAALDDGVGDILSKLRETHLDESTLVIFFSDNGGPTHQTTSRNDPLRGFKNQIWEGGIRTPAMMQWIGSLPPGKLYSKPVIQLDYHVTALAAAGAKPEWMNGLDGVNLFPYITDKNTNAPHEYLYWRYGKQWAIRGGDYKLTHFKPGLPQLFNLSTDIGESHDLTKEKPDVAKKMQEEWEKWSKQLPPPAWGGGKAKAE